MLNETTRSDLRLHEGGGARVKSTINSITTYFVGGHYEVTGSQVTKYYFAGSQRIAVRKNGTLSYMLSDHLGSTVATTNTSGQLVSGQIYKAWGEVRYSLGTSPTKYTFTGQYSNMSDFGLMFYNARWYDPVSGRFAQADTIIPPGNQGLDRFAYSNNNPLRYTDPSGHCAGNADDSENPDLECWKQLQKITDAYTFISVDPTNWTTQELIYVFEALYAMEKSFGGLDEFEAAVGDVTLVRADAGTTPPLGFEDAAATHLGSTMTFYDGAFDSSAGNAIYAVLHEFGHQFDEHGTGLKSNTFEDEFWDNCIGIVGKCFFGFVTGAKPIDPVVDLVNSYNPREDFASTFAAAVWLKAGLDNLAAAPSQLNFDSTDRLEYMWDLIVGK